MLSLAETNRRARASEAACEAALPRLMAAYHLALMRLSRLAVENFEASKVVHLVAADGPSWSIPDLDELFTLQYGSEVIEAATREARNAMALAATGPWASATDPAVRSRLTATVLQLLAMRITEVTQHVREHAAVVLRESLDAGLSVPNTAKALSSGFREFAPARARLIARTEMIGAANAASLAAVRETGAASHKRWLSTNDARTRPTHVTANGQVRAIDDPFDVGGAQLMHPGAEGAPAREVCNCRCTLVYQEAPLTPIPASAERDEYYANLEAAIAAADLPTSVEMRGALRFVTMAVEVPEAPDALDTQTGTRFEMLLAPLEEPTDDGRVLSPAEPGAIGWRDLPLSLMAQFETADGHDGARIVGRIETIEVVATTAGTWVGTAFVATGVFDDGPEGSEDGRQAARLARDGTLTGVSIDLAVEEVEMRTTENEPIAPDDEEALMDAMFGGGIMAVTRGSIMGATITPFPAFAEAGVTLVASLDHVAPLLAAANPLRTVEAGHTGPLPPLEEQVGVTAVPGSVELEVAVLGPPRVTSDVALGYATLLAAGICSLNDTRGWLGLARVVGGDTLRVGDGFQVVEQSDEKLDALAASVDALMERVNQTPPPAEPRLRRLRVERDPTSGQAVRYVEEPTDG